MDSRSEIPSRLRLTRQAHSFAATVDDSHFHATGDSDRDSTESDDDGSTPKLGLSNMSMEIDSIDGPLHFSGQAQAQSTPAPGREKTAAEQLRQVMKRSGSATPIGRPNFAGIGKPRSPNGSLLETDSETDDFETPRGGANGNQGTPFPRDRETSPPRSAARSSLKSLFNRALRDPGDTPEKPRRARRGSMDSSIAEESPIKWSMIRAEGKAKRMSLSDDEREEIRAARSGLTDGLSEKSFKSSVAMNYDQLRERLESSGSGAGLRNGVSGQKSDMTIDMEEATEVEQDLLSDRDDEEPVRSTTPPAPLGQSVSQFPSQFMGSNLLGENSDVHRMLQEAETDTTDSEAPQHNRRDTRAPVAGPSSKQLQAKPSFVRERTLSNNSSIGSLSPNPNSRPISRQSMNGMDDVDRNRERERRWNHPLGSYMERHRAESPNFSPTQSGFARARKTSLSSISSASSDGRGSPISKRLSDPRVGSLSPAQIGSRYTGMGAYRAPSVSPNQIRVGPRSRTTSQPLKPSSPGSLGSSTGSNGTQKPVDRSRTVSLTARPSSSLAHARSSPAHGQNGAYGPDPSGRPDSPTSSRSSSRASSHAPDDIKAREQNWNASRPKWNSAMSASLISERRRSAGEIPVQTPPPAEHSRRPIAAHQASSSPSSIPRPTIIGRAQTVNSKQGGTPKDKETNGRIITKEQPTPSNRSTNTHDSPRYPYASKDKENIHTSPSTTKLPSTSTNGRKSHTPPLSSRHQPNIRSRNGNGSAPPRAPSPSPSIEEFSEIEESEEHDTTPKIGPQPIPGSPTQSGPNGHAVTSSGFPPHISNKSNGSASTATSIYEKENTRKKADHTMKLQPPPKNSVASDPIDFHDSDLDSFQEEDIAASSSAPRVHNGRDLFNDEDDLVSQEEQLRADVSVLRPRQNVYMNGHEANLTAKRHSSVPANFSPPPSLMQNDPVTTTPQRRTAANVSKIEFKTPSPPRGMPALPDPPSSDDGESDRMPPVPITPANRSRFADMKTPRPPGAWGTPFVTPAPAHSARSNSGPKENAQQKPTALQDEINTPPASSTHMTTMAMKTPALPGGWVATPATIAAKRLQKVRFDPKDVATAPAADSARDEISLTSDSFSADGSVAMKAVGKEKPPSPRTPGRIRVMDAFGNEITPAISDGKAEKRSLHDELHAAKEGKPRTSDGRKSRIRVLDAMGNEIDDSQVQPATSAFMADERADQYKKSDDKGVTTLFQGLEDKKLERRQALELLQKTIAGLKDDFIKTDDPTNAQTTEAVDTQIADLKAQSIRAREDRERLLQKIREMSSGDRSSRSTFTWSALYSKSGAFSSHRAYLRAFVALLFLQFVLFLAFYRLTSMGARQLFLTTYVDPFYPELHLHITNPDILQLSMEPPERSNSFTSASSSDWIRSFLVIWYAVLDRISSLRETVCDLLRDTPRGVTWPPT